MPAENEVIEQVSSRTVVTGESYDQFLRDKGVIHDVEEVEPEVIETEDDEEESEEQTHKKSPKLQQRFSELTRQREEARQDAAKAREERESLAAKLMEYESAKSPEVKKEEHVKPNPSDFTDAFEYAEKLADWSAENAIRNREKIERAAKDQKDREVVAETWKSRLAATKSEIQDYDEVINSSTMSVSDQVRDAIIDSDVGPALLYHLAANQELVDKINNMSAAKAMRELGKLEAKLEKAIDNASEKEHKADAIVEKVKSAAHAPIKPLKNSSVSNAPFDEKGEFIGSMSQYRELRKAGKIK